MVKKDLNVCFVYWDPHQAHRKWAESVNAKFYSFVPFNSKLIKSNGILLHLCAFIKALFFLPISDVYLIESPIMVTALLSRTIFSSKIKVFAINSDPFLWVLPEFSSLVKNVFKSLIKRVNGYLSTSEMMDKLAEKTRKHHEIVDLYVNPTYFKVNANLKSKNACFIGPHLNTKKGVDTLVNVFSKLPEQEKRNLYLVGTIQDSVISEKIKDKKNIHVTKHVSDPGDYLKRCGLYLNLARFEPAGINILEAMAAGIPPIVSNMCGFSSVVRKVSSKLVVTSNENKIVKTVLWLEKSKEKRSLGKKAKNIVHKFTEKHSVEDFKAKFNKLLNQSNF